MKEIFNMINIKKILILLFLILLIFQINLFGKYDKKLSLNQLVFPVFAAKNSFEKSSLYIDNTYSIKELSITFLQIQKLIQKYPHKIFPIIIDSTFKQKSTIDSLINIYNLSQNIINDYNTQIENNISSNKQLVIIYKNNKENNFRFHNYLDLKNQYSVTTLDTIIKFSEDEKPIFNFWHRTGKLPNFIFVNDLNVYKKLIPITKKINNYPRIQGNVKYNNQPLENVKWLEFPHLITSGKFSIPIHQDFRIHISPYKEGFKFSPDIVYFTELTFKKEKIFKAYLMDINDDMVANFSFENEVINHCNSKNKKILIHNIQFSNDSERGYVAKFNGKNSFIDCDKTINFGNQTEMTLAIWVKADLISGNHAFIGKGLDFSFKIRESNPTFTTAEIKDHYDSKIFADSVKWQHIAIVVKENEVVKFYINGKFQGQVPASKIIHSNKSLLIGTNLWDEFYCGYMDDLKLWNRALNEIEILEIYNNSKIKNKNYFKTIFIPFFIFLLFYIGYKIKIRLPIKHDIFPSKTLVTNHINFFGGLKISYDNSDDLQNKLSPKTKLILVLLLIHTIKNGGISTKGLTDLLWPGFSIDNAKNNRSTYIRKLRTFLENLKTSEIIHKNKKWQIILSDNIKFDYQNFIELIDNQNIFLEKPQIKKLITIISKGKFLPEIEIDWLDDFRLDITNKLDNFLKEYQIQNTIKQNPELTFELSSQIRKFDNLNETALALQIKSQVILGNHSFAKNCYDSYIKEYKLLYDVDFSKKFQEFI